MILFIISLFTCVIASSVDIHCEYDEYEFILTDEVYSCIVKDELKIYTSDVNINEIKGSHLPGKINNHISGLVIEDKKTEYFPLNLGEKLENLLALRIKFGRLREVHQDDLKKFSKLIHLNLDENNIEALDDDLFEFNTELKLIWLSKNKIKSIGEPCFSELTKLSDLDLLDNTCTNERVKDAQVNQAISKIKQQCFKPDIELENLKLRYLKLTIKYSKSVNDNKNLREKNFQMLNEVRTLKDRKLKCIEGSETVKGNETVEFNPLVEENETTMDQLQNENAKLNETSRTIRNDINKLQTCIKTNTELNNQVEKMNINYQILKKSLANERKKSQDKIALFEDILSSSGNKFNDVQTNLNARFEAIYNQTSELMIKQQMP